MPMDMDEMLAKIKDRQWALAEIDWVAPGAETVGDEFRPKLKAFMADLCWIENVGARGFAAMAKKAPTPVIAEIYRYFHAEEQRHANAELALMRRWGMLDGDELPEPNVNIRLAIEWLDRYADEMPLSVLGTVIPMLEVALDGALLKFLLEEVHDPVCHQVFEKINNDESRHIAVDFEVLNMIGHARARRLAIEFVGNVASPGLIVGTVMYIPLLNRMRNNIVEMGLAPERLYAAVGRYAKLGERGEYTAPRAAVPGVEGARGHGRRPPPPLSPSGQQDGAVERAVSAAAAAPHPVLVQGADPRAAQQRRRRGHRSVSTAHAAVIVGAGFAGIGTAIKLLEAGIDDFVILERADRVGGTWRDTTYPGAACDIPSMLYSFSFAGNARWSRTYAPSVEILRYIERLVEQHGLTRHIRFGAAVDGLVFDEDEGELGRLHGLRREPACAHGRRWRPARWPTPAFPDIRGIDTYHRPQDPQRPMGPRLRLAWQTRRRGRHRSQRGPDRPRAGQDRGLGEGVPAHPRLGAAPGRPAHTEGRPGAAACGAAPAAGGAHRAVPRPRG